MQQRLLETNPNAFRDMVTTFLEANGRGYWETSEENIERLQELYAEVEDRIEGVQIRQLLMKSDTRQYNSR